MARGCLEIGHSDVQKSELEGRLDLLAQQQHSRIHYRFHLQIDPPFMHTCRGVRRYRSRICRISLFSQSFALASLRHLQRSVLETHLKGVFAPWSITPVYYFKDKIQPEVSCHPP